MDYDDPMEEKETKELFVPKNESEARSIESFLASEGVECAVVPFQDTAYPGITDRNRPWGSIRVPAQDLDRAKALLEAYQASEPENVEEVFDKALPPPEPAPKRRELSTSFYSALFGGFLVGAIIMYFVMDSVPPRPPNGWFEKDRNHDGKIDERTFFRKGTIEKAEIDTNQDGKTDDWHSYDEGGFHVREERDLNNDGSVDYWASKKQGQWIVKRDMNFDGKADAWEYIDGKNLLIKGEYDLNNDGKPDEWSFAKNGQVVERRWSMDLSGKVDKKAYYQQGIKTTEEFDLDHDGVFELKKKYNRFEQEIPAN